MEFEGRHVLVTGASRGIGRAAAERFAAGGARVAVHYATNREAAEEVRAGLSGDDHFTARADLADIAALEALVDTVFDRFGHLDVLVNNAGIFEAHPPAEASFDAWRSAWDRTLAVNLLGPAHLSFLVARRMIDQGGGRIVNVSSRGAFRGEPDAPAYGASKAGLNALGQSMAKALAPHGVTICTVAPGWVDTDMAAPHLAGPDAESVRNQSPLGRIATPEEVADVIAFLARPGNESITGCIVDVNGASYLRT
ncbi:MAG: SDR family oxidoreductase [Gemmatimonadales bacterium]|jgi:NAD(P)-dependent dehydrogenase (short-subunit alcohol dehydrogenase family)